MNSTARIKIIRKSLASGNDQVKFFVEDEKRPKYGYLLVNGSSSLEEVVLEIRERMEKIEKAQMEAFNFSFKKERTDDHNFYLYSA